MAMLDLHNFFVVCHKKEKKQFRNVGDAVLYWNNAAALEGVFLGDRIEIYSSYVENGKENNTFEGNLISINRANNIYLSPYLGRLQP